MSAEPQTAEQVNAGQVGEVMLVEGNSDAEVLAVEERREIRKLRAAIDALMARLKWRDAMKELPPQFVKVIVRTAEGRTHAAVRDVQGHFIDGFGFYVWSVVRWCPIPPDTKEP